MGKITYKYIDPPSQDNPQKAINFMRDTLVPLISEYWNVEGSHMYNKPLNINIISLVQMWLYNDLMIIVAYDDNTPCGFFIGVKFTHILYAARAVQCEVVWARDKSLIDGFYKYLNDIISFMDMNEIWTRRTINMPAPAMRWPKQTAYVIERFVKE